VKHNNCVLENGNVPLYIFFCPQNGEKHFHVYLIDIWIFMASLWSSAGWWRKAICPFRAGISISWKGEQSDIHWYVF